MNARGHACFQELLLKYASGTFFMFRSFEPDSPICEQHVPSRQTVAMSLWDPTGHAGSCTRY